MLILKQEDQSAREVFKAMKLDLRLHGMTISKAGMRSILGVVPRSSISIGLVLRYKNFIFLLAWILLLILLMNLIQPSKNYTNYPYCMSPPRDASKVVGLSS